MNRTEQQERISLAVQLGDYMQGDAAGWTAAKALATAQNPWFTTEHVEDAARAVVQEFLQEKKLIAWAESYALPGAAKKVGVVMAGNIPLVGFHDMLCIFISGHEAFVKLSQKDTALITDVISRLQEWNPAVGKAFTIADRLNDCDAYIATGSNNTARYFESYFGKYPHIIRRNRTSVAILSGNESDEELSLLADDVFMFYGLGCRSVTQLIVPRGYDFVRLLQEFEKHSGKLEHSNKWKNNYDYHLALYLLNRVPYMASDSLLIVENELPFSAVSVLHYKYYNDAKAALADARSNPDIQAIIGFGALPFGSAQRPALSDYADGVDTMAFLSAL